MQFDRSSTRQFPSFLAPHSTHRDAAKSTHLEHASFDDDLDFGGIDSGEGMDLLLERQARLIEVHRDVVRLARVLDFDSERHRKSGLRQKCKCILYFIKFSIWSFRLACCSADSALLLRNP